ncbi:zona pellucida-like domain-containing protein 1 isoform X2 [Xyrichtys novacula]|uniref:Zona pellucida-like domain-containing protein 1 isoform X2 n=1 Tax=Xyrichtys novacula TaxID=13765 RepID=A0AAV1FUK3_XYRNO|nr:zona pellucida-like domain-containing protein 1 isoform X2 [Xyrichtys novacula]
MVLIVMHFHFFKPTLRTMCLLIPLCLLGLIVRTEAQIPSDCIFSNTNRPPENSDIIVTCGSDYMDLAIYLCPMYQALYNESLMVLNNKIGIPECYGTADWTVDPPVLRFSFPIVSDFGSYCGNVEEIIEEIGQDEFSDFSSVQSMIISGIVASYDSTVSIVTFRPQIFYKFSCIYPLQYLLNNTEVAVSGVNVAVNSDDGSLLGLLTFGLFEDELLLSPMLMPKEGLELKEKIHVMIKAINLTEKFNVLLDGCFATPTPYPSYNQSYYLFLGCDLDIQTQVTLNGVAQNASFTFEAFRFVKDSDKVVSTFYVHCLTRLCQVEDCKRFLPNCSNSVVRQKREAPDETLTTTVSSQAIRVGRNTKGEAQTFSAPHGTSKENTYSSPVVAVIACIVILSILFFAMAAYFLFYIRRSKALLQ